MPGSDTRIAGEHLQAFLSAFGEVSPVFERKARKLFEAEGIDTNDLNDSLVSQRSVVDGVAALAEETGESSMYAAGKAVGENIPISDTSSINSALEELNEAHKAAFHDPEDELPAGEFQWEGATNDSLRVSATSNWPYGESFPHGSEFTTGIINSVAEKVVTTPEITEVDTRPSESIALEINW
jgi:hypothetical protein